MNPNEIFASWLKEGRVGGGGWVGRGEGGWYGVIGRETKGVEGDVGGEERGNREEERMGWEGEGRGGVGITG